MKQLDLFDECYPVARRPKSGGTKWMLYTDGASRNNPGPSGAGIFLLKDNIPHLSKGFFLGVRTNNQAEYLALLIGLYYAQKQLQEDDVLYIMADSELLIKQLKGEYRVRNPELKPLFACIKSLLESIRYSLCHVERELNTQADALANSGIDEKLEVPKTFITLLKKYGITF